MNIIVKEDENGKKNKEENRNEDLETMNIEQVNENLEKNKEEQQKNLEKEERRRARRKILNKIRRKKQKEKKRAAKLLKKENAEKLKKLLIDFTMKSTREIKMEQHDEPPRVCQEPEVLKTIRPGPVESPPPNCAICLGTCTNKCFTDCCLHQFCFSCLLEWSKIKAECPLCKQPFKSIIYNIKSNLEYEEHIIVNPQHEPDDILTLNDAPDYLFLPNGPRPQRHFQYRTTFTLEPGGEFAIQQLLLSHPRTNSISFPSERYPYLRFNPSTHSVDQRRNIYYENWWVYPQPDVTGRYRECSPLFFRENPAQAHRIIPWLNRELTALIDHTLIYPVQQEILDMLCQYSILSSQFRVRILPHLGQRTDHFIHEFYSFVRSPYDMIGYDRHSTYSRHGPPPIFDLSDEDSDVHVVVDSPGNDDCVFVPNRTPEVIVIDSESTDDSDVIIRTPTPPPIVDLLETTSNEEDENVVVEPPVVENERVEARSPQLPIKIRLKRSRASAELFNNYKYKEKRKSKRDSSSSSNYSSNYCSTSESSYPSQSSGEYYDHKYTKKKKSKSKKHKSDSKYSSKSSKYRHKRLKSETKEKKSKRSSKKSKKQKKSKRKDIENTKNKRYKKIKIELLGSSPHSDIETSSDESCYRRRKSRLRFEIKTEGAFSSNEQITPPPTQSDDSAAVPSTSSANTPVPAVETNTEDWNSESIQSNSSCPSSQVQDLNVAGPSNGPSMRSMVVVKDKEGGFWYKANCDPSKRFGMYRPDLNTGNESNSDSD